MDSPRICTHREFSLPQRLTNSSGEPVETAAVLRVLSASLDGCVPCQEFYRVAVLDGPPDAITCLAGAAFLSLSMMMNAVVKPLCDMMPGGGEFSVAASKAPTLTAPTRMLYHLFEKDDPQAGELLVRGMGREDRAAVLEDALDTLAAVLPR